MGNGQIRDLQISYSNKLFLSSIPQVKGSINLFNYQTEAMENVFLLQNSVSKSLTLEPDEKGSKTS